MANSLLDSLNELLDRQNQRSMDTPSLIALVGMFALISIVSLLREGATPSAGDRGSGALLDMLGSLLSHEAGSDKGGGQDRSALLKGLASTLGKNPAALASLANLLAGSSMGSAAGASSGGSGSGSGSSGLGSTDSSGSGRFGSSSSGSAGGTAGTKDAGSTNPPNPRPLPRPRPSS